MSFKYNKLPPFKWYVLENFPFIEADFDALTNWQLFCKLGHEMNKIINSTNTLGTQVQDLTDYVSNYFENLDVQEEINNKLDEMAESGELEDIIASYLNVNCILGFNTVANMKGAENLQNGSICKTLGESTRLDGNGGFYKIRTLTSGDVIDEENIIALTNYPTLIAELIPYSKIKDVVDTLEAEIGTTTRNAIYIGNSFVGGVGSTSGHDGIFALTKDIFNNAYSFTGSGTGFYPYTDHEDDTFVKQLQRAINTASIDKASITDIIIVGAWGDSRALHELGATSFASNTELQARSFVSLAKENYPNASRISYIWAEGRKKQHFTHTYDTTLSDEFGVHNLMKYILPRNGISYLGWIGFNITLNSNYFSNDNIHPNDAGYTILASDFKSAYLGTLTYHNIIHSITGADCPITEDSTITYRVVIQPDCWDLDIVGITLKAGSTPAFNTVITLIDFSELDWCLPIPYGTTVIFGTGFNVQTSKPNESGYNPANAYIARVDQRLNTDTTSTKICATNFSTSKTISADITNAIVSPNQYHCSLEYR